MVQILENKLFILSVSTLFISLSFLPFAFPLPPVTPEDHDALGFTTGEWFPKGSDKITNNLHFNRYHPEQFILGSVSDEVIFTGTVTINESSGDFPICYGLPHCNVTVTEILVDPSNLLHLSMNISICYNKTRMLPEKILTKGDEIEVYGFFHDGTGPFQYVGHIVVEMAPFYVKVLGINNPPDTPLKPSGPTEGSVHVAYPYYTAATDPDGDRVHYRFDWGDGTYSIWSPLYNSGTLAYTYHAWSQPGTFTVRAQAMDEYGALSDWSTGISVTISSGNAPPGTPEAPQGPITGLPGGSYTYSAITTDPEGDDIRYYFDWDDGSGDWTSLVSSGRSVAKTHSWDTSGSYLVRVKAQDEHGAESTWSPALSVTISGNRPPDQPERPTGPQVGKKGRSYAYLSVTTDPDGDQLYYLFDWGDGTQSSWTGPYTSGQTVTVSHIWNSPGTYPIKVKAKDTFDQESVWSEPLTLAMPKTFNGKWWDILQDIVDWVISLRT